MAIDAPHEIYSFWFGSLGETGEVEDSKRKSWWKKSPEFDAECANKFEDELVALKAGKRESLLDTARGSLCYILLADQISRNIYRNTPASFASDGLALRACTSLIDSKQDVDLLPIERGFLYMPLMHSEDQAVQVMSILKFSQLKEAGYDTLSYAIRHKEIIDRFGRYPHRNEILGRESTAEELEFLQGPGSSF